MAAQCDALSGYLQQQQSDQGSNSERSTDSPLPGSEEDLSGPHQLPDPEWTEERFRVDRKKLEFMLLGIPFFKKHTHICRCVVVECFRASQMGLSLIYTQKFRSARVVAKFHVNTRHLF